MGKGEGIRRYSAAELRERRQREGSRTDVAKVMALSEDELERQIAEDPDFRDIPADWFETAVAAFPVGQG